jgi:hypothetical protein
VCVTEAPMSFGREQERDGRGAAGHVIRPGGEVIGSGGSRRF